MNNDKKLKEEFDEYFKGVNLPDNLTADAKTHVKKHNKISFKWVYALAPIAVAAVLIIGYAAYMNLIPGSGSSPMDGKDENTAGDYYSSQSLAKENLDINAASAMVGLEFTKAFEYNRNVYADLFAYRSADSEIKFVEAAVTVLHYGYRHDAVIIAEFADKCLEDKRDFLEGEEKSYMGNSYIYNSGYDNGEPVHRIYTVYKNVKYYISVTTSEQAGYLVYLNLIYNS